MIPITAPIKQPFAAVKLQQSLAFCGWVALRSPSEEQPYLHDNDVKIIDQAFTVLLSYFLNLPACFQRGTCRHHAAKASPELYVGTEFSTLMLSKVEQHLSAVLPSWYVCFWFSQYCKGSRNIGLCWVFPDLNN